jgi:hypothetical protein
MTITIFFPPGTGRKTVEGYHTSSRFDKFRRWVNKRTIGVTSNNQWFLEFTVPKELPLPPRKQHPSSPFLIAAFAAVMMQRKY